MRTVVCGWLNEPPEIEPAFANWVPTEVQFWLRSHSHGCSLFREQVYRLVTAHDDHNPSEGTKPCRRMHDAWQTIGNLSSGKETKKFLLEVVSILHHWHSRDAKDACLKVSCVDPEGLKVYLDSLSDSEFIALGGKVETHPERRILDPETLQAKYKSGEKALKPFFSSKKFMTASNRTKTASELAIKVHKLVKEIRQLNLDVDERAPAIYARQTLLNGLGLQNYPNEWLIHEWPELLQHPLISDVLESYIDMLNGGLNSDGKPKLTFDSSPRGAVSPFCCSLSKFLQRTYHQKFHAVVAQTASCIFNTNVTDDNVRTYLARWPAGPHND